MWQAYIIVKKTSNNDKMKGEREKKNRQTYISDISATYNRQTSSAC